MTLLGEISSAGGVEPEGSGLDVARGGVEDGRGRFCVSCGDCTGVPDRKDEFDGRLARVLIRFAWMLFGGSNENEIGTGPIDMDNSCSSFP